MCVIFNKKQLERNKFMKYKIMQLSFIKANQNLENKVK